MNKDVLSGLILLGVAGVYYWATLQIPDSSLSDEVGAQGLPRILAVLLAGLAVLIVIRGAARGRQFVGAADAEDERPAPPSRALGLLAIAAGYIVAAPLVGFAPALALLIAAVALYEGMRPSWRMALVAAGGALAFWLLFVRLLGVEQPAAGLF
jgi:putative tricarboxylic transport membrane protein